MAQNTDARKNSRPKRPKTRQDNLMIRALQSFAAGHLELARKYLHTWRHDHNDPVKLKPDEWFVLARLCAEDARHTYRDRHRHEPRVGDAWDSEPACADAWFEFLSEREDEIEHVTPEHVHLAAELFRHTFFRTEPPSAAKKKK